MPKATRKKVEKAADFKVGNSILSGPSSHPQKAKLKLGKGKKAASNATDTSFKARCELWPYLRNSQ